MPPSLARCCWLPRYPRCYVRVGRLRCWTIFSPPVFSCTVASAWQSDSIDGKSNIEASEYVTAARLPERCDQIILVRKEWPTGMRLLLAEVGPVCPKRATCADSSIEANDWISFRPRARLLLFVLQQRSWLLLWPDDPCYISNKPYNDVYCRILYAYTIIYANIHQRVFY